MYILLNIKNMFIHIVLEIDVNFHKLDEYSSTLLKKSQQPSTKKDSFSSVSKHFFDNFSGKVFFIVLYLYFSLLQKLILM